MNEQPTVGANTGTPAAALATASTTPAAPPSEVIGMPAGAQTTATPGAGTVQPAGQPLPPATQAPQSPFSTMGMLFPFLLVIIIMVVMTSMAGRKERRKRAELMGSLGNGDKVATLGGIIGSVVEIKDDEVVLRVDEVTNTRIRFSKAAVQTILRKNDKGSSSGSGGLSFTEAKLAPAKAGV